MRSSINKRSFNVFRFVRSVFSFSLPACFLAFVFICARWIVVSCRFFVFIENDCVVLIRKLPTTRHCIYVHVSANRTGITTHIAHSFSFDSDLTSGWKWYSQFFTFLFFLFFFTFYHRMLCVQAHLLICTYTLYGIIHIWSVINKYCPEHEIYRLQVRSVSFWNRWSEKHRKVVSECKKMKKKKLRSTGIIKRTYATGYYWFCLFMLSFSISKTISKRKHQLPGNKQQQQQQQIREEKRTHLKAWTYDSQPFINQNEAYLVRYNITDVHVYVCSTYIYI